MCVKFPKLTLTSHSVLSQRFPITFANSVKVSATLKIAIFPYLRFQRFQIDMLESFLLKKKIRRKYYFCRKISGVKDFFSLIILIDR